MKKSIGAAYNSPFAIYRLYTNKYGGLGLGRNFRLTYEHTF